MIFCLILFKVGKVYQSHLRNLKLSHRRHSYEDSYLLRKNFSEVILFGKRIELNWFEIFLVVYGPNEMYKGKFANNIWHFTLEYHKRRKNPTIYGDGTQTRDSIFHSVMWVGKSKYFGASSRKKRNLGFTILHTALKRGFSRIVEIIKPKCVGTKRYKGHFYA